MTFFKRLLAGPKEYDHLFSRAIRFSQNHGLDIPFDKVDSFRSVDLPRKKLLEKYFLERIGSPPDWRIVCRQCVGFHFSSLGDVSKIVGSKVALTIGAIQIGDGPKRFAFNRSEFRRWLKNGVPDLNKISLHAWLTTQSLEIIDFTFTPSYMIANGQDLSDLNFTAQHWTEIKNYKYWPIAVGNDIPEKLGLCIPLSFFDETNS